MSPPLPVSPATGWHNPPASLYSVAPAQSVAGKPAPNSALVPARRARAAGTAPNRSLGVVPVVPGPPPGRGAPAPAPPRLAAASVVAAPRATNRACVTAGPPRVHGPRVRAAVDEAHDLASRGKRAEAVDLLWARLAEWPDALQLWTTLVRQHEGQPNALAALDAIDAAMRARDVAADPAFYNVLVGAYGKCGGWQRAEEVAGRMGGEGWPDNPRLRTSLVQALCAAGEPARAEAALAPANVADPAYAGPMGLVLRAWCAAGQPQRALQTLTQLQARGAALGSMHFNTVMAELCRRGELQDAEAVLQRLKDAGVRPTCATYTPLVCAAFAAGDSKRAWAYFEASGREGVAPDVALLTAVQHGANRGLGEVEIRSCLAAWRRWEDAGGTLDAPAHHAIVSAYGRLREGAALQAAWTRFGQSGAPQRTLDANVWLAALCAAGEVAPLRAAWASLRRAKVAFDAVSYATYLGGLLADGTAPAAVDEALRLHGTLAHTGVRLQLHAYAALCRRLAAEGRWQDVLDVDAMLRRVPVVPDMPLVTQWIAAAGRLGRLKVAKRHFASLAAAGEAPDLYAYAALADAMGRAGAVADVRATFATVRAQGMEVTASMYTSLADAYYKKGAYVVGAEALLAEAPRMPLVRATAADLLRKGRAYARAHALCLEVLDEVAPDDEAYATAYIVARYVGLHTALTLPARHRAVPFGARDPNWMRLQCLLVYEGETPSGALRAQLVRAAHDLGRSPAARSDAQSARVVLQRRQGGHTAAGRGG